VGIVTKAELKLFSITPGNNPHRAGFDTNGRQAFLNTVTAKVTFSHAPSKWVKLGRTIGTGPGAIFTTHTAILVNGHNAVFITTVGFYRADFFTDTFLTVVTGYGDVIGRDAV